MKLLAGSFLVLGLLTGSASLERHYVGKHKLGVNRVTDGARTGSVEIVRKEGRMVLSGAVRRGDHYLEISGTVEPVSRTKFFLDGEISGVPDLSFMDKPLAVQTTRGRFLFEAKFGRKYWRMYEVDGQDCVCWEGCGNDFCYIDIEFLR